MPRAAEPGFCRLLLHPDPASAAALDLILGAHAGLLEWLEISVPAGQPADLVALHRSFYEAARAVSGLPARSVTLAFKDWVRRRRGEFIDGLPLDDKLYAIKGIESVSIATLGGRVTIPFHVGHYGRGWVDPAPARLLKGPKGFELKVSTDAVKLAANLRTEEETMSGTESALKRIGRVIAGMTNLAIDAAEGVNPEAVIAQAIREIDAAADEVRVDLGRATAERHRLDARRQQLLREKAELDGRVHLALDEARDDLAEAGIARQIDIEAQVGVLVRLLGETDDKIARRVGRRPDQGRPRAGRDRARHRCAGRAGERQCPRPRRTRRAGAGPRSQIAFGASEVRTRVLIWERSMSSLLTLPEIQPFAIAGLVVIGLLAIEIVSTLFGSSASSLLDAILGLHGAHIELGHGIELHAADHGADSGIVHVPEGPLAGAFYWLNAGRVPLLVLLTTAIAGFAVAGLVVQIVALHLLAPLPTPVAVIVAIAAAIPGTRWTSRLVSWVIPRDEN